MPFFLVLSAATFDSGGYINLLKLLPVVVIFFGWARLMTWLDKDAIAAHLPREILNTGLFIVGLIAFAFFFVIPNYWVALGAVVVVILASVLAYMAMRQRSVGLGDLKSELGGITRGIKKERKAKAREGEVQLLAKSGPVPVPERDDPDYVGYEAVQEMLVEPLRKNAERIEMRPSGDASAVQYVVDGVAYSGAALDPQTASACLAYLKKNAGLDVEDRRKPQVGSIKAALDGKRHELEIATAGTTAGESMRITVNPRGAGQFTLDTIGLLPDQLELVQQIIQEPRGIVLVCAPRANGLTTLLYSLLRSHDAFVLHIQTIERAPRQDLEGITQNKLPLNASTADEARQVEWVASTQPDILMIDEVTNSASAHELIRLASEGKRVYVGMRAGTTFDALAMWRRLVGDDGLATSELRLIIAGRLLRRLCMACKVAYTPDSETLRKLNMDPQRVQKLYQARTQSLRDNRGHEIPCEFCQDLHFKGRFGVYELFLVDDEVRQAIASGGTVNQLKTIFRKQRLRYLQELALAQVEAGETSIQEVLRVLRAEPQAAPQQQAPAKK